MESGKFAVSTSQAKAYNYFGQMLSNLQFECVRYPRAGLPSVLWMCM